MYFKDASLLLNIGFPKLHRLFILQYFKLEKQLPELIFTENYLSYCNNFLISVAILSEGATPS